MPISKIAAVGGAFMFVIIAGEWLMMQSYDDKEKTELTQIAGKAPGLETTQGQLLYLK